MQPARAYALVTGLALSAAGVLGFFAEPAFSDDPLVRGEVLGLFDVNGFHNVIHLASGAAGLAAFAAGPQASRLFATGFGAVYLTVAVWGVVIGEGDSILGVVPVDAADNLLHAGLGVLGILAGATTVGRQRPASAR